MIQARPEHGIGDHSRVGLPPTATKTFAIASASELTAARISASGSAGPGSAGPGSSAT